MQHYGKHLIENPRGFTLKPDIFLRRDEQNLIADTKWKIVASKDDISQADLYQLYAYGKKYDCGKLYLIYPKINGAKQEPMKFKYDDKMQLEILCFDLENDSYNDELIKNLLN